MSAMFAALDQVVGEAAATAAACHEHGRTIVRWAEPSDRRVPVVAAVDLELPGRSPIALGEVRRGVLRPRRQREVELLLGDDLRRLRVHERHPGARREQAEQRAAGRRPCPRRPSARA
jgi:hypothetical protein